MTPNIRWIDNRSTGGMDIGFCSGIGKRSGQEDAAFCFSEDGFLYAAVMDGMGGLNAGSLASARAVAVAEQCVNRHRLKNTRDADWMAETILGADAAVYGMVDGNGNRLGCGCTFVSVSVTGKELFWASAGDSRAYLFHGSDAFALTTDLNYAFLLNQQLERGEISPDYYQREMVHGEALTSFVGMGGVEMIDRNLEPLVLCPGDSVLLCSDGVYRTMDDRWLCDLVSLSGSAQEAADLVAEIMEDQNKPNQDNYTCIIIKVKE